MKDRASYSMLQLRYFALRAAEFIDTLRAYDGSGIPNSDAQNAFFLLRKIRDSALEPELKTFGTDRKQEIARLEALLEEAKP